MKKILLILPLIAITVLIFTADASAQCAMCAASLETSKQEGGGFGSGINSGIMYLSIFPYLILGTIGFLIYRKYKRAQNAGE